MTCITARPLVLLVALGVMQSATHVAAVAAPKFVLNASLQQGSAVKDSVAGIEFGTMATVASGSVKYWDLRSATLTRSGGATLTEGQYYTHAFCKPASLI